MAPSLEPCPGRGQYLFRFVSKFKPLWPASLPCSSSSPALPLHLLLPLLLLAFPSPRPPSPPLSSPKGRRPAVPQQLAERLPTSSAAERDVVGQERGQRNRERGQE